MPQARNGRLAVSGLRFSVFRFVSVLDIQMFRAAAYAP
jgi:hypothetical protein